MKDFSTTIQPFWRQPRLSMGAVANAFGLKFYKNRRRKILYSVSRKGCQEVLFSYNQWKKDFPLNPTIWESTIRNALGQADELIWLYIEEDQWLVPGGVDPIWLQATRNAIDH